MDLAIINGNYALGAGLTPSKDAIALESGENNPYANVLVVRTEDKDKESLKTLAGLLCSQQTKDWIAQKYSGSVISTC